MSSQKFNLLFSVSHETAKSIPVIPIKNSINNTGSVSHLNFSFAFYDPCTQSYECMPELAPFMVQRPVDGTMFLLGFDNTRIIKSALVCRESKDTPLSSAETFIQSAAVDGVKVDAEGVKKFATNKTQVYQAAFFLIRIPKFVPLQSSVRNSNDWINYWSNGGAGFMSLVRQIQKCANWKAMCTGESLKFRNTGIHLHPVFILPYYQVCQEASVYQFFIHVQHVCVTWIVFYLVYFVNTVSALPPGANFSEMLVYIVEAIRENYLDHFLIGGPVFQAAVTSNQCKDYTKQLDSLRKDLDSCKNEVIPKEDKERKKKYKKDVKAAESSLKEFEKTPERHVLWNKYSHIFKGVGEPFFQVVEKTTLHHSVCIPTFQSLRKAITGFHALPYAFSNATHVPDCFSEENVVAVFDALSRNDPWFQDSTDDDKQHYQHTFSCFCSKDIDIEFKFTLPKNCSKSHKV